jgi:hypothetical protein
MHESKETHISVVNTLITEFLRKAIVFAKACRWSFPMSWNRWWVLCLLHVINLFPALYFKTNISFSAAVALCCIRNPSFQRIVRYCYISPQLCAVYKTYRKNGFSLSVKSWNESFSRSASFKLWMSLRRFSLCNTKYKAIEEIIVMQ